MKEQEKTALEVRIAMQSQGVDEKILQLGELTPYSCPECHGVLSAIKEGAIVRYRCHTGHAYSADSLLTSITEKIEETLWAAIRGVEESVMLLNNLGDHYADINKPRLAAMYFQKAKEAEGRAASVRKAVFDHEQLSKEIISTQVREPNEIA